MAAEFAEVGEAARAALDAVVVRGSEKYEREKHLPRVLPVGPEMLAANGDPERRALLARLARALRQERNRGRAGHWTYDLNRHIALAQAYAGERRLLARQGPVK